MRLRNVKNAINIIESSSYIIKIPSDYKGKWKSLFNNDNPIHIEIGIGKGKFILENAIRYPNINFIGIEKFDSVVAKALLKIGKEDINNLKIIKMDALDIASIFNNEVDLLYLNFSDPWPKAKHQNRRLTSHIFLEKYDEIFKNNKIIEIKTDNRNFFEYSIVSLNNNGYKINEISLDLDSLEDNDNIKTEYEEKFIAKGCVIYFMHAIK